MSTPAPALSAWNLLCLYLVRRRRQRQRRWRARWTPRLVQLYQGLGHGRRSERRAKELVQRVEGRAAERRRRDLEAPPASARAVIFKAQESAEECAIRQVLVSCACGPRLLECGCGRVSCVRCAARITGLRARTLREGWRNMVHAARVARWQARGTPRHPNGRPKLYPARLSGLIETVFTIPPGLRPKFAGLEVEKKKRRIGPLRRALWHLLRDEFAAFAACIIIHPVGDKNPRRFHPHLNVMWTRGGLRDGHRVDLRPWLPPAELERLKVRWAELIGCPGETVDVHTEFIPGQGYKKTKRRGRVRMVPVRVALGHAARYYGRVFVGWRHYMPKAVQWYGIHPNAGIEPEPLRCPKCRGRFVILEMGDQAGAEYARLRAAAVSETGPP